MGAPRGNKNAQTSKKGHVRKLVSISGPTLDLIYESLALEGNGDPSSDDIKDAVYYAVRQVYGRKIEDQVMII